MPRRAADVLHVFAAADAAFRYIAYFSRSSAERVTPITMPRLCRYFTPCDAIKTLLILMPLRRQIDAATLI